jgi:hypothetical protein
VHSGDTGDVTKLDIYFYLFHTAVNNFDCTSEQECVFPLLEAKVRTPLAELTLSWNFLSRNGELSLLRAGRKQEVLERTNRLLSLIRHGPHSKRRAQQFFYCCVCIPFRGNVSTEPLPSNDRGVFTEPLPSNDKGIFIEPLPSSDKGILFF